MDEEKNHNGLIALMWIAVLAHIFTAAGCVLVVLRDLQRISFDQIWIRAVGIALLVTVAIDIILAIWYFSWQWRAVRLRQDNGGFSTTPAWSIAMWFIPFLSLIRPYQIVKEIGEDMPSALLGTLKLWWGLFLASNFLANISNFVLKDNEVFIFGSITISYLLWVLAGILFIRIFRSIQTADRSVGHLADVFA